MPSQFPSTFASAAAGTSNSGHESTSNGRGGVKGDGVGGSDWSRSRTNGTATFSLRRPSQQTSSSQQPQIPTSTSQNAVTNSGIYVPPHQSVSSPSRNGLLGDARYGKEQMLGIFKAQKEAGETTRNVSAYFMPGWDPTNASEHSGSPWNKRDDMSKDPSQGPEICWDSSGGVIPLGLIEMTDEEKEHFISSVNSPLKPPPQNISKEQSALGTVGGRKSSLSQNQSSQHAFGLPSPASSRPGTRRRETSDPASIQSGSITSPTSSRTFRDDNNPQSSPPLVRRRTDIKEMSGPTLDEKESPRQDEVGSIPPFGRRTSAGPSSIGPSGSSSWASNTQNSAFSPMGAFGSFLGNNSGQPNTTADKRSGFGSLRGESRFSKLMSKESNEDISAPKEKSSFGSLAKVNETQENRASQSWRTYGRASRGMSSVTDPFGGEDNEVSGSVGSDPQQSRQLEQADIGQKGHFEREAAGLSGTGISSMGQIQENSQQQRQRQHTSGAVNEPYSPTETNPFTSPAAEREDAEDVDTDDSDLHNTHHPGLSGLQNDTNMSGAFAKFQHGMTGGAEGDRSQVTSLGATRGLPSLGGLGGFGSLGTGWQPTSNPIGTPDRERSAFSGPFGNSVFSPIGDLGSPSAGGGTFGAAGSSSSVNRGSKLGSLFPPAMQAQMQSGDVGSYETKGNDKLMDLPAQPPSSLPAPASGFGTTALQDETSLRGGRTNFDETNPPSFDGSHNFMNSEGSYPRKESLASMQNQDQVSLQTLMPGAASSDFQQSSAGTVARGAQSGHGTAPVSAQSSQPPPSQQRMMVMPDRIRWIYRDPQGATQGPWSGLEMHDWYKAGFFTPDLMVKKTEDKDYEPLGQLIRRIGNSREPFLVPQIGIPHGPSNLPTSSQWPSSGPPSLSSNNSVTGSVQPPFAGAFPSFGTTLTAEQQNALERRKQEEQYLMARQKEYLAQQQVLAKHAQLQGAPHSMSSGQLQHHSSAHSLHSQPSFGSITSPSSYQPTPPQAPMSVPQGVPPMIEAQLRQANGFGSIPPAEIIGGQGNTGSLRDDDTSSLLNRLSLTRDSQQQFGAGSLNQVDASMHSQQVAAIMAQRAQLQREQAQFDANQRSGHGDGEEFNERLQNFNALRAQTDVEPTQAPEGLLRSTGMSGRQEVNHGQSLDQYQYAPSMHLQGAQQAAQRSIGAGNDAQQESLSLSQQVKKAASAKQASASSQPQSPWAKVDNSSLPQPFPPPQSISPLPAPAAQRNRQNLPDALHAETSSRSQTPSLDTPSTSVAPWAKESSDGSRGPSLREIQEAETRKAAKAAEIAAAARRAAQEQERLNQPAPPAPGLPSSATWGNAISPATPLASGVSVWSKPLAGKASAAAASDAAAKNSLSQIQREEEVRKARAQSAATANAASSQPAISAGKRYADLASKTAVPAVQTSGGAWTTVGSGGAKPKPPPGPALNTAVPPGFRASSGNTPSSHAQLPSKSRQASYVMKGTAPSINQNTAKDELMKWARATLLGRMNQGINVDNFVQQLITFPADLELIKEGVHGNSETVNAQHFAEEFVRRRKLADAGLVDPSSSNIASSAAAGMSDSKSDAGGWSAVAKKGSAGPAKEDNAQFKVVAGKKKGRK